MNYHFRGTVAALTSIVHGGDETFGTTRTLRREKFIMPDGRVEELPVISGNSLRGQLRDCAMVYMMRLLDLQLSPAAFDFLTSGGALSKQAGRAIDVQRARRLREAIPAISVFGGAVGNHILRGKLRVGKMIPLCLETTHLIPEDFQPLCVVSVWDTLQVEGYTRADDKKNERLRELIEPQALAMLEGEAEELDEANLAAPSGVKQQMRYENETVAAGARFFHEIFLEDVTEQEYHAFLSALYEFSRFPFIGGRSAVGHGKIAMRYSQLDVNPLAQAENGTDLALTMERSYNEHLQAQRETIVRLLGAIA